MLCILMQDHDCWTMNAQSNDQPSAADRGDDDRPIKPGIGNDFRLSDI